MLRSVSFVIDGIVASEVRVTGNLDGTLSFEITRLEPGSVADLEAVFFDLNTSLDGDGFSVFGDAGLSLGACVAQGLDTLGRRVTIRRAMVDPLGDFDIGIRFGPLARAQKTRAPRATGFTLAHDKAALTPDMIDRADFGLRYCCPGAGHAEAGGAQTPNAWAGGPVAGGPLELAGIQAVDACPLADDTRGGVLAVIDLQAAWRAESGDPGGNDTARGIGGGVDGGVPCGEAPDGSAGQKVSDRRHRRRRPPAEPWPGGLPPA